MKSIASLLFFSLVALCATAQDKIILVKGDTISAAIIRKSESQIEYNLPGETLTNVVASKDVKKIILANGRTEIITKKKLYYKVEGPDDWDRVTIVFEPTDVTGRGQNWGCGWQI